MLQIQVEIGADFSKHLLLIYHICHNMVTELIKIELTDHFRSPSSIFFLHNIASCTSCTEK